MKLRWVNSAAVALLLSVCGWVNNASAALIQTDYLSAGDGKLVFDDVNQFDWLRLDAIVGQSVTTALTAYQGFRVASQNEAMALYDSLFPGLPLFTKNAFVELQGAQYDEYDQTIAALFGRTGISNSASLGLYQAMGGNYSLMGTTDLDFIGSSKVRFYTEYGNTSENGISYASFLLLRDHTNEVIDSVTEPTVLSVFALGLLAMGLGRNKKNKPAV